MLSRPDTFYGSFLREPGPGKDFPGTSGDERTRSGDDTASSARAPRLGSVAWHGAGARGGSGDGSGLGLPVANCLAQFGRRNRSRAACVAVRCIRDGWSGPRAACGLDGAGGVWPPPFILRGEGAGQRQGGPGDLRCGHLSRADNRGCFAQRQFLLPRRDSVALFRLAFGVQHHRQCCGRAAGNQPGHWPGQLLRAVRHHALRGQQRQRHPGRQHPGGTSCPDRCWAPAGARSQHALQPLLPQRPVDLRRPVVLPGLGRVLRLPQHDCGGLPAGVVLHRGAGPLQCDRVRGRERLPEHHVRGLPRDDRECHRPRGGAGQRLRTSPRVVRRQLR